MTVENIEYGRAIHPADNEEQVLMLDAYFPPESDQRTNRPAVVFAHGGGFSSGQKVIGRKVAQKLAQRGYVVFSIDYRKTGEFHDPENNITQQQVVDASEDMRAAIRFVRSKATEYGIDTNKIIASGSSAGA